MKIQRHLKELPKSLEEKSKEFYGIIQPKQTAIEISEGTIDPDSHERFSELLNKEEKRHKIFEETDAS